MHIFFAKWRRTHPNVNVHDQIQNFTRYNSRVWDTLLKWLLNIKCRIGNPSYIGLKFYMNILVTENVYAVRSFRAYCITIIFRFYVSFMYGPFPQKNVIHILKYI